MIMWLIEFLGITMQGYFTTKVIEGKGNQLFTTNTKEKKISHCL